IVFLQTEETAGSQSKKHLNKSLNSLRLHLNLGTQGIKINLLNYLTLLYLILQKHRALLILTTQNVTFLYAFKPPLKFKIFICFLYLDIFPFYIFFFVFLVFSLFFRFLKYNNFNFSFFAFAFGFFQKFLFFFQCFYLKYHVYHFLFSL